MTIFGGDRSHYDDLLGARDGLDFVTHKAAEGHRFYRDDEYGADMAKARALGVPVLGSYFVNHPGTVADQADWWLEVVNAETPWWREQEVFLWQIDAEKFSYMSRAPSRDEINALGDAICARAGIPASSVVAYAPKWLYGDSLTGLKYKLWASNYGSNPAVPYRDAYPGDASTRWAAYSGQTPIILQYGSRLTIGGQTTCDANAFRGTLAELTALLTGGDMTLTADEASQLRNTYEAQWAGGTSMGAPVDEEYWLSARYHNSIAEQFAQVRGDLRKLLGQPPLDPAAFAAAVVAELGVLTPAHVSVENLTAAVEAVLAKGIKLGGQS